METYRVLSAVLKATGLTDAGHYKNVQIPDAITPVWKWL